MWEKLASWFRFLWNSGKLVEQNVADIKDLQEDNRRLALLVQSLIDQNERLASEMRQSALHERERQEGGLRELELKLRLQLSEELRRLPPAQGE